MLDWKKITPYTASVAVMLLVALIYCSPVFQGKSLVQDDIVNYKSLMKETQDYREANDGDEPLWTTRVFSGMTTMVSSVVMPGNISHALNRAVLTSIPGGPNHIFLAMLGFFILLVAYGVNPWLALAASVAYGLSSNLLVSLVAGHNSKVATIGYMAPALGAVALTLKGKNTIGALLTMLFVGLLVAAGHYQIMYYFLLMCLIVGVVHLYYAIKEKTLPKLLVSGSFVVVAGIIGALPSAGLVYNVYDHQGETIRGGKSELTERKAETASGGLDKEYAMRWSYGPLETLTTVVPSLMGGASTEALPEKGNVAKELTKFNVTKQQREAIVAHAPTYIGEQPFTLGPVYFGAGFVFLFILAMILVKGQMRAWVASTFILSLTISWGSYADIITGFLFDHFPMYNKFRTPSMAMCVGGMLVPFFGIVGLAQILSGQHHNDEIKKALRWTAYISGGLMLLLLFYGISSDWTGAKDAQFQDQKNSPWAIDSIYQALLADRKVRFLTDWFFSTLVMALTAILVWFHNAGKVKLGTLITVLALAYGADMWHVSKRYLNNDDFKSERDYDAIFEQTPADKAILADNTLHFRVINLTRSPWTDHLTCYWHKNVGGHHPAKIQRYQDLIEHQLSSELQLINSGLMQTAAGVSLNPEVSSKMPAYNMLNTRYYIIQNDNPAGAVLNPTACGNAWFVSNIKPVENADEEIAAISNIDPLETAVIHKDFAGVTQGYNFGKTNANIILEEISPKYLKYKSSNTQDGLAVFSEVYYPNGWTAWIDGNPTEIIRANYVLRAMKVPAGEHTIEMRFEPASYTTGITIAYTGSALYVLFAAGLVFWLYKQQKQKA